MKKWIEKTNFYALCLEEREIIFSVFLYDKKEDGYYARAYIDCWYQEVSLAACDLEEAKQAAEKWYAECLRENIESHKRCISQRETLLEALVTESIQGGISSEENK